MGELLISVVIPYRQRLANISVVLAALADQTMDQAHFEVVVAVLEYAPEYIVACRPFTGALNLISVLISADWNVSHARNLGIRHASGQVLVVLDADMVLPPSALRDLYDRHFAHQQRVCVLGQLADYNDEIIEQETGQVTALPYSYYQQRMTELDAADTPLDARWSKEYAQAIARFPWSFVTTAFVALPLAIVREYGLFFDEGFHGWGPEDQEWGYRIAATGTPIVLGQGIYGVHMPHRRDTSANRASAHANNRYYLAKWPRLELELALAFGGWLEADRRYPQARRELAGAVAATGHTLGVVRGRVDGADVLAIGVEIDQNGRICDPDLAWMVVDGSAVEVLPLAGFALPFPDQSFAVGRLMRPVFTMSEVFRRAIVKEAKRVALTVAGIDDGE